MPAAISDAEIQRTLDVLAKHHGNQTHAGVELGISQNTVWQRLISARRRGLVAKDQEAEWKARESFHSGRRLPQTADECWAVLDDYIGRSVKPRVQHKRTGQKSEQRIVVAGDFHAPFEDKAAVAELIRRERGADQLIINGDLQDFYSVSRFIKYERVSMELELAAVDALLGQLSAAFPEVLIVEGNHDTARFEKQLRSLLSIEMVHVIEYLSGGNLSVLRVMAKRYPNVKFAETTVGRFGIGWFWQQGDLLVAHAERFSVTPGAALRKIEEGFSDMDLTLGLKPWRVLIAGHTHQLGWFPWHSNRLLVEGACMCATHGYQLTARMGGRPQRRGYVTLTQTKGVTDVNSVRPVWLDDDLTEARGA